MNFSCNIEDQLKDLFFSQNYTETSIKLITENIKRVIINYDYFKEFQKSIKRIHNSIADKDAKLFLKEYLRPVSLKENLLVSEAKKILNEQKEESFRHIFCKYGEEFFFSYMLLSDEYKLKLKKLITPVYLSKIEENSENEILFFESKRKAVQQPIVSFIKLLVNEKTCSLTPRFRPTHTLEEVVNSINSIETKFEKKLKKEQNPDKLKIILRERYYSYKYLNKAIEENKHFYDVVYDILSESIDKITESTNSSFGELEQILISLTQSRDKLYHDKNKLLFINQEYSVDVENPESSDIIMCKNIFSYITTKKQESSQNMFSKKLATNLEMLKKDNKLIKTIEEIEQQSKTYQTKVLAAYNIFLSKTKKAFKDKNENTHHNNYDDFYKAIVNLNDTFEKELPFIEKLKNNSFLPEMVSLYTREYSYDMFTMFLNNYKYKLLFKEVTELKKLKAIKKRTSEIIKDKETILKLQELENVFISKINYVRGLDFEEGWLDYSIIKQHKLKFFLSANSKFSNSFTKNFRPVDCLDFGGKYFLQGLTLHNNTRSLVGRLVKIEESDFIRTTMKDEINEGDKPLFKTISKVFMYESKYNNKKTLFIAGISSFNNKYANDLEKISDWKKIIYDFIKDFAKQNNYENVSFNMQPLGDIRTPSTKYIHEFTRFVAQQAGMPEEHYTYEKIGSGRKPRFFMLKQEHKEQYLEEIKIARDPDLIGDFYIEGMYPTKKESLETKLITNPNQHEFKPTFIKDKGYAPIITIKIK